MKYSKLFVVVLCAATPFAHAETVYPPTEIVITASRFDSATDNAPVGVTVITAEDIKKSAARTLPEILAQHAGIQVRSTDGTPDMSIDLRGFGMSGNQNTLVLRDGQPLNDIDLTSVRWSAIPLDSIERIEIVNGGGAVLYGGGASGGTINIITKKAARGTTGSVSAGLASYAGKESQFSFSAKGDAIGLHLSGGTLDSNNYRVNNNLAQNNLEGDVRADVGQGDIALKFGADNQSLRYPGVRKVNPTTNVNQFATDRRGTDTPFDYGKRQGNHVSLGTSQRFGFGDVAAELSYRNKKQQAYFAAYGGSYLDTTLNVLSFTPRVKLQHGLGGVDNELVVGSDMANWSYDSARSTSPATVNAPAAHVLAKQTDRALYAQNTTWFGDATRLSLGARTQRVSYQARDAVNAAAYASGNQGRSVHAYEIGLRHEWNQNWSLFGRVGRSFRVATVDEIFNQYGGPVFDSRITMLEPQTSHDRELGIDYRDGASKLRATLYQMNISNEIHYNALTFTNMNLSPTRREGLELEGRHAYGDALEVSAAYSYTVAKFRSGNYGGVNVAGNNVPLVPKHKLALGASWKFSGQTTLNGNANYVGSQHFDNDQANTFGQKMPAYTTVDLKLTHQEGPWLLAGTVNNLFDQKYFSYAVASTATAGVYNAYPMRERNFSLSASYRF